MRITILALTIFAVLPVIASAQAAQPRAPDRSTAATKDSPPALHIPLQHGFSIIRTFNAVSGLTGWVMREPNGEDTIVYTTPDGQTLLAGELLTSSGQDLSELYTKQYVPAPDLTPLWTKLAKANLVVAGTRAAPKSAIYVIMDPNCIFCHMLWIALKPYESAGLQVRWIPVGFLHEDSSAKAAALLKGGAAAMEQCQEHFDLKTESGGIVGIGITPDLKVKLDSNLELMRQAGVQGTPGIFYKDAAGHVLRQDGMPSISELPGITGLPAQPETDPQLARFNN